jgi:hypothetical protein
MKKLVLIASILLFNLNSFSQAPAIEWQKAYGGSSSDEAKCIQKTSDGGYIIAGTTSGPSNGDVTGNHNFATQDFWIVKVSSTGTLQWQKTYGGTSYETAYSIQQTTDGGYIIAGDSDSNNGDVSGNHIGPTGSTSKDIWVIKINNSGTLQWQKALGGSNSDSACSVYQTADGGYIVGGTTDSVDGDITSFHGNETDDFWLIKLNSSGVIQWQKTIGGSGTETCNSMQKTADGGYILTGLLGSNAGDGDVTCDNGSGDAWVVKVNTTGTVLWDKSFNGANGGSIDANSIKQTADGGYVLAGKNYRNYDLNYDDLDYFVLKMDGGGNLEWKKSFGGSLNDTAYDVQQTTDGGYIVAGTARSTAGDVSGNNGLEDYWIIKLNNAGILVWQKALGGSIRDVARSIQQTADGGFIVAGDAFSSDGDVTGNHDNSIDFWVVKLAGPVCGSTFEDSGASGNYSNNENIVYTFCPDFLGQEITVTFTTFNIETGYDALYVYNGSSVAAPQILSSNNAGEVPGGIPGGFWGTVNPGFFTSTSADGCLTFKFVSDSTENFSGWTANVTCSGLSTSEFEQQTMALYPNPAKTILNIHVFNQTVPDRVAVTDLTGKILLQTQNTKEINVADLAYGIYIIEAVAGDKKFTRKFVKE